MGNPLSRFLDLIRNPSSSRTTSLLVIVIIALSIPLTVFVAQQQQEIRQRASFEETGIIQTEGTKTCTTTIVKKCLNPGQVLNYPSSASDCSLSEDTSSCDFLIIPGKWYDCKEQTCTTTTTTSPTSIPQLQDNCTPQGGRCEFSDLCKSDETEALGVSCPGSGQICCKKTSTTSPAQSTTDPAIAACEAQGGTCLDNGKCILGPNNFANITCPIKTGGAGTGVCPQITAGGNPGAGGNCSSGDPNQDIGTCTSLKCASRPQGVPGHTISVCTFNSAAGRYCYDNNPNECWPNSPCPVPVTSGGPPSTADTCALDGGDCQYKTVQECNTAKAPSKTCTTINTLTCSNGNPCMKLEPVVSTCIGKNLQCVLKGACQGVPFNGKVTSNNTCSATQECCDTTPTTAPGKVDCTVENVALRTPCQARADTCSGAGTQTITKDSGTPGCNPVTVPGVACSNAPANCTTPNTCSNGQCIAAAAPPPPAPGDTIFSLNIGLNGLGITGDSKNASSFNSSPLKGRRFFRVELYDSSGTNKITEKTGDLNLSSGKFTGNINMGSVTTGNYVVRVKSNGFVKRRIPGAVNVVSGQTVSLSSINLPNGDISPDESIDTGDYNILLGCIFKTFSSSCEIADLDDNGKVDQFDYNLLLREFNQKGD